MVTFSYFSKIEPYCFLNRQQREEIFRTFRKSVLSPEAVIIQQGQSVPDVGIVRSGKVKIVIIDGCGNKYVGGCLGPGDLLFDMAVLTGQDATASAISTETTTCILQSRQSFLHALDTYLPLHLFFYQRISLQLRLGEGAMASRSVDSPHGCQAASKEPLFIRRALEYIHGNYQKPICLEMIANETAMSKFHFSRQFKRHMGVSFKQYLNRVRVNAAKEMMLSFGYNVTEASYAVGFNDASYFSRVFRDVEGVPPKKMIHHRGKISL